MSKNNFAVTFLLLNSLVFGVSTGINSVSFPFILYQNLVAESAIGIAGALEILAGMLISGFLFRLSKKIGMLNLMLVFCLLDVMVILILPFYHNFILWILLIFIHGFSWFSVLTLRQSWLNIIVSDRKRALVMAINSTALCSGFTLGPVIVKLIGAGQYLIFVISALFVLFSCVFLWAVRSFELVMVGDFRQKFWRIIRNNKRMFFARFILDFQNAAILVFTVIYGVKNGLSAENSGLLVSAFMGISLFDFLIGMVVRKAKRGYIDFGFVGCLVSILLVSFCLHNFVSLLVLFAIYGWFMALTFIICITRVNNGRQQEELVSVNSAFQAVALFGGLCGVFLTGMVMQIVGSSGFVLTIVVANIIYFAFRISSFWGNLRNGRG